MMGVAAQQGAEPRANGGSSTELASAPLVPVSPGPLGVVRAADREIARLTAVRARAVAEFAASRPASADRQQGERGAMSPQRWAARPEVLRPVSEWATQELQVALAWTEGSAQGLLERSLLLVTRLPGVLAAIEAGVLHAGHIWPMLDLLADVADDRTRAEVEAEVLRWVAERASAGQITTPPQLRDKVRRVLARRGARDAAQRLARAVRSRGVYLRAEGPEGMASVTALLTGPEGQALYAALAAYADAVDDEPGAEPRSRAQKMADCLMDLVLRPGDGAHPPVQVALTLVAAVSTVLGGDAPGEVNGQVVPAETVRQLLRLLTGTDLSTASATTNADADTDADAGTAADVNAVSVSGVGEAPADTESAGSGAEPAADPLEVAIEVAFREAEERWWAEFEQGLIVDPDTPGDLPPPEEPLDDVPSARWWAAADRAVMDATEAGYQALAALGHAERMVRTAEVADARDEASWPAGPAGPAGRVDAAHDALEALTAAAHADRAALGGLLSRTAGGGLADRPRIALVDALSGALVSLTDLPQLRRSGHCGAAACRSTPSACTHDLAGRPPLGAPGGTSGYRPSAALDRFIRARDRRCRFPGCRRLVARGELDHRVRYPDGPTAVTNLAGFCVGNHRGKHQAPGWTYDLLPDATLVVTTPTGLRVTTEPPPY